MGRGRWETPANYVTVHHEDNPTGQPYREALRAAGRIDRSRLAYYSVLGLGFQSIQTP